MSSSSSSSSSSSNHCIHFIENNWRKEICSNCFRLRQEHNSLKDLLLITTSMSNVIRGNGTVPSNESPKRYQSPYRDKNSHILNYSGLSGETGSNNSNNSNNTNYANYPKSQPNRFGKNVSMLGSGIGSGGGGGGGGSSHSSKSQTIDKADFKLTHHPSNIQQQNNKKPGTSQYGMSSGGGVSVNGIIVNPTTTSNTTSSGSKNNNTYLRTTSGGGGGVGGGVRQQVSSSISKGVKMEDVRDGNYLSSSSGGGDGPLRKPRFNIGNKKSILKSKEAKPRKMNVTFPKEVVEVISCEMDSHVKSSTGAYGGASNSSDSEEGEEDDLSPPHPMDSSSISEILEKTSITLDEKEFHRLTQKNTNFNSIKTNLLGKTNIEIGPIVGCTGGKSMEFGAKPLISIGTFESRNEPLKIRKKIDEYSTNEEQDESFLRKKSYSNSMTSGFTSSIPSSSSSIKSSTNLQGKCDSSKETSLTTNSNFNKAKITSTSSPIVTSTATATSPGNPKSKNEMHRSSQSPDCSSIPKSILKSPSQFNPQANNNSSNTIVSSGGNSSSKTSFSSGKNFSKTTFDSSRFSKSNSSTSNSSTSSTSNLIILTEANQITSKRTSFLRDFVDSSETKVKITPSSTTIAASSDSNGVTVVNTSHVSASLEPSLENKDSLEEIISSKVSNPNANLIPPKPLERSKVKLHLNEKLTHPLPVGGSASSESSHNGTDDSEFDDSLEDSGLDIGAKKTRNNSNSKSNPKESGSSSDSGNENDYILTSDKVNNRKTASSNINAANAGNGLFISVEDSEESSGNKKKPSPAKLSPDSVLFPSDVSEEMSGISSSAEDEEEEIPRAMKRTAPRPPPQLNTALEELYANQEDLANEEDFEEEEEESFYDDVSTLKDKNEVLEEEDLYDDCSTLKLQNDSTGPSAGTKGGTSSGSYDFQNSSNSSNGGKDEDLIPTRPDGGIEFIGIRKIDSESFLRERSPSPLNKRWSASTSSYTSRDRERSSSTSPKPIGNSNRKKVNQFFSTLGKKAGAAFSSSHLANYSSRNKSPVTFNPSGNSFDSSDNVNSSSKASSAFPRSQSIDEVTSIRTQELYATVTPTSMKFKGLAPVLNKLSKIDLNLNLDKSNNKTSYDYDPYEDGTGKQDKLFKKKKMISTSIKKFLGFGANGGGNGNGMATFPGDKSNDPYGHELTIGSPYFDKTNSSSLEESCSSSYSSSAEDKPKDNKPVGSQSAQEIKKLLGKPPPPPPRVHSLDLLHKVGVMGPHGTVSSNKPARPPPPVRSKNNKVAPSLPSFTSVFDNPNSSTSGSGSASEFMANGTDQLLIPPSKPKRKNSSVNNSSSREPSSHDSHIANLNLETLKLIANQNLTKITHYPALELNRKLSWSSLTFLTSNPQPISHGPGFALYSPILLQGESESLSVLIQESNSLSTPFKFTCVQTQTSFEDIIPFELVPWVNPSDYSKTEKGIKGIISILPALKIKRIQDFVQSSEVPSKDKHLALLQSIYFWGSQQLSDLLVIQSTPTGYDSNSSSNLHIHPIPFTLNQNKNQIKRSSLNNPLWVDFEMSIKSLLLASNPTNSNNSKASSESSLLLSPKDKSTLLEKLSGSPEQIQMQLKLFFQLKLFIPSRESKEFAKIMKDEQSQVEQGILNWLDKERALCMKEAVERSLNRDGSSISPWKKAYLEFLVESGNNNKAIVEMFEDLFQ